MTATARAYIGLGANLGTPIEQVRAGMSALGALPASNVVRCSSLYRTAPVGLTAQPDFINAVCALDTTLAPHALLQYLLSIEREHGRERGPLPGGPRTLDLDLLLYGYVVLMTPSLSIPHPRLHERAFVLYPLQEIAPTLVVPGHGPVADLARACAGQAAVRVADRGAQRSTAS
jgi:2-amino-4-hydroxy-6-hydroxymethyldihydropteridine diphosphokinase